MNNVEKILNPEHFNFAGKSAPMTIITPVRPYCLWLLRLVLWIYKHCSSLEFVKRLRFIHFAQWSVMTPRDFARSAPEQSTDILRRNYFLFSTNYNGPWDQYIDSFSLVKSVRKGMFGLWFTSDNFPGAFPVRPFKRYIRYNEYRVDAYYNAYPDATIRDVESALEAETLASRLLQPYEQIIGCPLPTGDKALEYFENPLALPAHLIMNSAQFQQFQPTFNDFTRASAQHLGGTRRGRTPSLQGTAGPEDLQL